MRLWRISRHPALDGAGGLLAPGRFHSIRHPVIYSATSPAAALLEVLVHLDVEQEEIPLGYRLHAIDVDDPAVRHASEWTGDILAASRAETRAVGNAWLRSSRSLLLFVPSRLVPETRNALINPRHADAAAVLHAGPFWPVPFDPRLLGR